MKRALSSYGLAFLIFLVAAIWMGSGTLVRGGSGPGNGEKTFVSILEGREDGPIANALGGAGLLMEGHSKHDAEEAALTIAQRNAEAANIDLPTVKVRTELFEQQEMPIAINLRGVTQAKAKIGAVAETAAFLETMHVEKGQRVNSGDLLCTLDVGTREASLAQAQATLAQAKASLTQAQLNYNSNQELRDRGAASVNSGSTAEANLAAAEASLSAAEASLKNANAEIERTKIIAKVSGIIEEPIASEGTMLSIGSVCATIVQLDPMLFVGKVSEANVDRTETGLPAHIRTINGYEAKGSLTFVSSSSDAATRSFAVEITVPNADFALRDGVSANAIIEGKSELGHLLPQSVLTLNDDGLLGVRVVEDSIVAFYPVEIESDTRDGVWVTGLPKSVTVITVGQEFVGQGQKVDATSAERVAAEESSEA